MARKLHIRIAVEPSIARAFLIAAVLIAGSELASETLTLVTTYPAPSGVYNSIVTVGNGGTNTILARSAGNVGIGTTDPAEKLEVNGNIRLSPTTGSNGIVFPDGTVQTTAPPNVSTIVTGTQQAGQSTISCPAGKTLTGGGCLANIAQALYRSFPASATTWECDVGGGAAVTPYAICR